LNDINQKAMPYVTNSDLPERVTKHLPEHAQSIYRKAFNNAWEQYKERGDERESTAHRVAWAAVEKKYEKSEDGSWVAKDD
jgi:cation transport regulator